jgi:hypothetical protein
MQLMVLGAFLPLAELLVIAQLNLVIVTWYYALFALGVLAVLAGVTVDALARRGRRRLAAVAGVGAVAYSIPFLIGYFTFMYGDRPRWQDASGLVAAAVRSHPLPNQPSVYATVPGVVAYYLGVDPAETMGHRAVQIMPAEPHLSDLAPEAWFVVERSVVSSAQQGWLEQHCAMRASFPARTGPKDRTLLVYQFVQRGST